MHYLGLAFQIAVLIIGGILGGIFIGYYIDKILDTAPLGIITGIIAGIFISGVILVKQIKELGKEEEKTEKKE